MRVKRQPGTKQKKQWETKNTTKADTQEITIGKCFRADYLFVEFKSVFIGSFIRKLQYPNLGDLFFRLWNIFMHGLRAQNFGHTFNVIFSLVRDILSLFSVSLSNSRSFCFTHAHEIHTQTVTATWHDYLEGPLPMQTEWFLHFMHIGNRHVFLSLPLSVSYSILYSVSLGAVSANQSFTYDIDILSYWAMWLDWNDFWSLRSGKMRE